LRIIIVGGGRTGYHLVQQIPRSVIIEKNPDKVERLNSLVGVKTVLGDGADEKVLLSAGLEDADAVIIVTADDQINYKVASIAKKYGVRNIITRMENPDNETRFNSLELSAILCPTTVVAEYIKELIHPGAEKEYFIKKILVPIVSPDTLAKAFEEALQLSLKTDAQLILVGNNQEYVGEERKILSLLDLPASIEIEKGDITAAVEKHAKGADLIVVDPEEMSYFEKIIKKSIIKRLLARFDTPILVSRHFKPYKRILLLADSSNALLVSFEMARLFGEIFRSQIEIMVLEESESIENARHSLRDEGKAHDFKVEKLGVEGNVNIETVKLVKSGDYDLTILPWGSPTLLKDDLGDSIVHNAPKSILVVKG